MKQQTLEDRNTIYKLEDTYRPYDNDTVATDLNLETSQSGSFRDNGPR